MCGFIGIFGEVGEVDFEKLTETLAHRGPDDQGIFFSNKNKIFLGHRRLAIIDTTNAGKQPMSYFNQRYRIVFNGEIYNYQQLKDSLLKQGYSFDTETDTEVILASYAKWGHRCLSKFRGMFSFVIWDSQNKEIFGARDRLGIKPFYYYLNKHNGSLYFSSEIRTLMKIGSVKRIIDKQAVWDYLSCGSFLQPRTIIADIKALMPGSYFVYQLGASLQFQEYWKISDLFPNHGGVDVIDNYSDAKELLIDNLNESAKYHSVSSVPIGVFLSGGVDSTIVTGLMAKNTQKKIKTFSIGFNSEYEGYDEKKWARLAANYFQTEHHEIVLDKKNIIESFESYFDYIDQPSVDGMNTYLISKAASQYVPVVVSGIGGDEIFYGYPQFKRIKLAASVLPNGSRYLKKLSKYDKYLRGRLRVMFDYFRSDNCERYTIARRLISEDQKKLIMNESFIGSEKLTPIKDYYTNLVLPDELLLKISTTELQVYLLSTLLRDSDNMSMANSLELRPLLLDHNLIELAYRLPSKYKLSNGVQKKILVETCRDLLPIEIAKRPKKGFELPIAEWLKENFQEMCIERLKMSQARELFEDSFIANMVSSVKNHKVDQLTWAVVLLLFYIEKYDLSIK